MSLARRLYHRAVVAPGLHACFRFAMRRCATVFMCHRFTERDRGIVGLDPDILRRGLEYLRRHHYELLSLNDLLARLADRHEPLTGAVVFTIDDGYADHARVAAAVFAEYDCPVTTFLTTGFVDGTLWMWWDKIEYVFTATHRTVVPMDIGTVTMRYDCSSQDAACRAAADLVERCKPLPHDEKLEIICRLSKTADVELPVEPPERYRPMTWDDAGRCEALGMTFGPHTVTHPILTSVSAERSAWEVSESWRRLSEKVQRPVPVFCYPNGQRVDFGDREIAVLRAGSFAGAVTGEWGLVDRASFGKGDDGPFRMRRRPFPHHFSDLVQYVCGIERCKERVRSWL